MANKNFKNYAIAGNNVALSYDDINDNVTIDVNVDKNDVGLGNVDNTSDINKPISTLVQNALNLKEGTITAGTTAQYWRGDKTFQTLDKTAVGLSNVDNTSDANKPISTATQTALNGKQATISLTTTGSSGASTFAANVLNIPNYTLAGLGGIGLTALSSIATGLTYNNTTGVFSLTTGYAIPTTASASNWDNAYTNRITSLTTTGSSGAATLLSNVLNIPNYTLSGLGGQPLNANLTSISALTYASTSFVKMTAAGTFALDTNTYLTAESDTLASVTGRGNTTTNAITVGGLTVNTSSLILFPTTFNVGINQSTDAGFRLDVNGTARIQGTTTITPAALTGTLATSSLDIAQTWNTTGTPTAIKLNVTNTASNVNSSLMDLQIGGVSKFNVNNSGSTTLLGSITAVGSIIVNSGGIFSWSSSSRMYASANGNIVITNNTENSFNRLQFGGTTSAFPSIKRNAAAIDFRLADDSAFATINTGNITATGLLTTTGSITAASAIARGVYMNQTLVAAANNDVLVGLDIAPTFTNGAFTGVSNIALRVTGGSMFINNYITTNGIIGQSSLPLQITSQSTQNISFYTSLTGSEKMRMFGATGNWVIQNGGTFTDAGYRLDVVGADSRFNGIRAGLGAGQVAGNVCFGDSALGSNVSSIGLVAIGFEALKVCTGANNIALGYQAGSAISSGAANIAIGRNALGLTNTGSSNIAIGRESLFSNTTGSNNTAIGFQTASGNFSGCTILGREATATANNQFVVGSSTVNAGAVSTASVTQTKTWDVIINGVAQKILLA